MPTPKAASLSAQISALEKRITQLEAENQTLANQKLDVERGLSKAENRIARAKIIIADQREELAELRGYIRHGHEQDDAVSDRVPLEHRETALVPRSAIARSATPYAEAGRGLVSTYDYGGSRSNDREHWTAL